MDLVIVLTGVLDQWVIPVLIDGNGSSWMDERVVNGLRLLRVFRVLRLLKLLRVVMTASFAWTDAPWFQTLMAVVIAFNAVLMGLETDIVSADWWWIEQALLIIY